MKGNEARPNDIQLGAETNQSVTSIVMSRAFAKITNKTKRKGTKTWQGISSDPDIFIILVYIQLANCFSG